MSTEAYPIDCVRYLEDNLPDLICKPDLNNILGARLAVEYIGNIHDDSSELTELYRSVSGLALSKTVPANRERPADQTWRAQALLALAAHKVNTRDDLDVETMLIDFQRPFDVSSPINYRYIRTGILQKYMDSLRKISLPTQNQKQALEVTGFIARNNTLKRNTILVIGEKAIRMHIMREGMRYKHPRSSLR